MGRKRKRYNGTKEEKDLAKYQYLGGLKRLTEKGIPIYMDGHISGPPDWEKLFEIREDNMFYMGDYVQAEEILGLMDQKWYRKEEFWILKIRYLAERKKGAELQQCLRQMKEEHIYLSSKSKEVLAFWLD